MQKADAVFEGGGVKGIGLVGALAVAEEEYGYTWENVAGTSAGAIVAALVAVGYKAAEIKKIIQELDYKKFKDKGTLDHFPIFGPLISLLAEKGIYEGEYLEEWLEDKLQAKRMERFGNLPKVSDDPRYKYKLRVITADITNERLVVLPGGAARYAKDPDELKIARAVRMSMSIPIFYEPVIWKRNYFVDGGVLSNFPVWLFDSEEEPPWPTFGFRLAEPEYGKPNKIDSPLDFIKSIITTMMEAHDKLHVETEDHVRTIDIPTLGIRTTDFNLSAKKAEKLFLSGEKAARKFFQSWDFYDYKRRYRRTRNPKYLRKVQLLKKSMVV